MSRYEVGESYFLRARLADICPDGQYQLRVAVPVNSPLKSEYTDIYMANVPGILLTAEDIATVINTERDDALEELKSRNAELEAKLAESKATIGKQSDKLRELQARIVELNEANSSLGENRDALNNEAAVHMTSIHNLQVAVEVLAEKIFEMRCEQDG